MHDALQELLDHLEGMLSNEAVVVTVGQAIVEVKPQVGDVLTHSRCAFCIRCDWPAWLNILGQHAYFLH